MKLLAIDGNSILNRAFYGIRPLTTKDGRNTNGIYGFMNILGKLIERENPDGLAIAFDVRKPTFRHEKYAQYKAGRKGMPPELAEQFAPLKELLTSLGYHCIEFEGYEADDILGTLACKCEKSGDECVIATGDKDSLQLVSETTKVLLATTKMGAPDLTEYQQQQVFEKYGVSAKSLIELKALAGDSSDNIPGVAGVGEKTAQDLILKYKNIDYIYDNIDKLDIKDNLRNKLIKDKEMAFLSRELGTIFCQVPLVDNIENYKTRKIDKKKTSKIIYDLELIKLAQKIGIKPIFEETDAINEKLKKFVFTDEIVSKAEQTDILDVIHLDDRICIVADTKVGYFKDLTAAAVLLENPNIKKRVYNYKDLYRSCFAKNITVRNIVFDVTLAAYLLNPSSTNYDLDRLCVENKISEPEIEGSEYEFIKKAVAMSMVCDKLSEKIEKENMYNLLVNIEIPLAKVLADMEEEGFLVDSEGIRDYGEKLTGRINQLQKLIWDEVGYEFNLNSPKQLGIALFETMDMPFGKKTKSGYSTNADVLEKLRYDYPVVENVLEYRGLVKLKSTYCDGLTAAVGNDGRIHSTLNQTETRTGRISSTEPNLQNIPVRKVEGKLLRKYFIAKEGYLLCDADYSQIELRVLAHISDDRAMKQAFNNDVDIHTLTASQVFNMPIDFVTPQMRSRAKAVNFGIVYGIGAFSLSKDIGVTRKQADEYIKGYFETYPRVREYMTEVVEQAKEKGYVSTVFGRRRAVPELKNSNGMIRSFGERVARNMPIQGTAADIIKMAMIGVAKRLKKEFPKAKLIMQVHDELIVESPEDQAEDVCRIIKEEMEKAVSLSVKMPVDVHCGKTWFDAKE